LDIVVLDMMTHASVSSDQFALKNTVWMLCSPFMGGIPAVTGQIDI
jgi:hypothetical protein